MNSSVGYAEIKSWSLEDKSPRQFFSEVQGKIIGGTSKDTGEQNS